MRRRILEFHNAECQFRLVKIRAEVSIDDKGWKVYALRGSLFFASAANFATLFSPKEDPQHVVIEFCDARVVDHSAIEAIDALAERYQQLGKTLHLRHLSSDCRELLDRAKGLVEINEFEDPHYHTRLTIGGSRHVCVVFALDLLLQKLGSILAGIVIEAVSEQLRPKHTRKQLSESAQRSTALKQNEQQ